MRFANPLFLTLLFLIPLLAFYERRWGLQSRARLRFSSLSLATGALKTRGGGPAPLLRLMGLSLLILALARPQEGRERQEASAPVTDIMLCVDTSGSMQALDFKPRNRLDAAKDVLREFISQRLHDRLGLVVFAGWAVTQSPLTLDHASLLGFLDHVKIGMIPEDGTAIGDALAVCAARLKNSAAKSKIIILLTDGRSNRGAVDPVTAARAAAALGVKIHVVGTGAPGEALFPVQDGVFGTRYVKLPEDLDEETLRRVADAGGGTYFRATSFDKLKEIYAQIDRMEKTEIKTETFADFRDRYFPLLLLAGFFLAVEGFLTVTFLRRFP